PELVSRERIERYQVDLAGRAAQQRKERARRGYVVVHAVEHHIFERDEIARRLFDVAAARGEQLVQRMLAIDRHETVAQRIVGRVQRYGERDRAFVAQAMDHRRSEERRVGKEGRTG